MAAFQPDSNLLTAYFEGNITDAALKAAIEAYIADDADPALVEACMAKAWNNTPPQLYENAAAQDWRRFRMMAGIRSNRRKLLRPFIAAAASLLLLISYTAWMHFKPAHDADIVTWQVVTASPGHPHSLQLPDGSDITLFPGASIRYNRAFNTAVREVRLSGRAFFNVTSAAERPFLVTTGQYTTQVLGTSFEVNDQPQEAALSITLVSGKVRLLAPDGRTMADLQPRQQAVIHTRSAKYQIAAVNPETVTAWTTGHLSYDQATLKEVCTDLEDWYKAGFRVERKELLQKRITAEFRHIPLAEVMDILSRTAGFKYRKDKDTIVIY
ncbi:FecR family protein [Chitinophaga solisilvae]|uniref:FecR family protein n=1 Tax=Chitinophaga solisilvae TaxID=1233460 RepID=UPI00136D7482|nr:FecR domain-containing protein [Chitinophaga solisilvae]